MSEISVRLHIMEKCWKNFVKIQEISNNQAIVYHLFKSIWLKSFVKLILNFKSFGSKQIKSNQANKQMR